MAFRCPEDSGQKMSDGLDALRAIFLSQGQIQRYALGQPLCESGFIPSQILLIDSGNARLIGKQNGRLSTLARLEQGSFIGLASLLRGYPCEELP